MWIQWGSHLLMSQLEEVRAAHHMVCWPFTNHWISLLLVCFATRGLWLALWLRICSGNSAGLGICRCVLFCRLMKDTWGNGAPICQRVERETFFFKKLPLCLCLSFWIFVFIGFIWQWPSLLLLLLLLASLSLHVWTSQEGSPKSLGDIGCGSVVAFSLYHPSLSSTV